MSLTDNPTAVAAAIKAYREGAMKYTLMDINQKPGEGNYDRVEMLKICDAIRAAESVACLCGLAHHSAGVCGVPGCHYRSLLDEQDTMVMKAQQQLPIGDE